MKQCVPLLLALMVLSAQPACADQVEKGSGGQEYCRKHNKNANCNADSPRCKQAEGGCSPEQRGRCGKRRGDWYGARQPVATATEARGLLQSYYAGSGYAVSGISEQKWGFSADILDKSGAVVDRVMIDKRSGRIRSLD